MSRKHARHASVGAIFHEIEKVIEVTAIVKQSVVEAFPAIILIKDRQEIARLEGSKLQDDALSKLRIMLEKFDALQKRQ